MTKARRSDSLAGTDRQSLANNKLRQPAEREDERCDGSGDEQEGDCGCTAGSEFQLPW